MAGVMKALEQSEHAYMSHQSQPVMPHQGVALTAAPFPYKACLALLCIPALSVSAWLTHQSYQDTKLAWQDSNQGLVQIVEVPIAYQQLSYPSFEPLKDTTIAAPEAPALDDMSDPLFDTVESEYPLETTKGDLRVNSVAEKAPNRSSSNDSESILKGLDLSSLSPELALRVEAAIGGEESQTEPANDPSNAEDLSQHAERWSGKLPALNFQTHVYSSESAKRWVKINDVEYQEGNSIGDGLELIAINPQSCVIRFRNELIQIPALYDWQG